MEINIDFLFIVFCNKLSSTQNVKKKMPKGKCENKSKNN